MKYSDDIIQSVRDATDIVEMIGDHVSLKKRGKSWFGLCPFHQEKSPSFHVDPVRQFYHCFGCGEGGNAFTFLMQMDRISFPEAVRVLADKAGISLPEAQADPDHDREIENLYNVHKMATEFYRDCYLKTKAGQKAQTYMQDRGFDSETVDKFLVGYAPNLWDGLIQKAQKESLPLELLEKAGLIIPRQGKSGYYDRFRGRLMFPIANGSGRFVGFGGRALQDQPNSPKYLNSPESPIYQKSFILYGLYQSKNGIHREDRLLVVEGYTDLMRLHQHGLDFAVATSGTALTEGHAAKIARFTKNIILIFDGDEAGFQAAIRGMQVLLSRGLYVQVVTMPQGHDPDSFLRENGREAMEALLETATDVVDFMLSGSENPKNNSARERSEAAQLLLQTTLQVKDPVERSLMIRETAEKLGIDEQLLHKQIRKLKNPAAASQEGAAPDPRKDSAVEEAENLIIRLLLTDTHTWVKPVQAFLKPEHMQNAWNTELLKWIFSSAKSKGSLSDEDLFAQFSDNPELVRHLSHLVSVPLETKKEFKQLAIDCILKIRLHDSRQKIRDKQIEIKNLQKTQGEVTEPSREWMQLKSDLTAEQESIQAEWKKIVEFIQ